MCSRRGAIQIHVYLTLPYLTSVKQRGKLSCCDHRLVSQVIDQCKLLYSRVHYKGKGFVNFHQNVSLMCNVVGFITPRDVILVLDDSCSDFNYLERL